MIAPNRHLLTFSLQSGSHGNAIYVEAGGVRLLVDAGISARQAELRARRHGRTLRGVDALLVSHDHHDHVRCAGVYQRLFRTPIYATEVTYRAARAEWGRVDDVRHFPAGDSFAIGPVLIHTLPTPHDAVDGVAFVIEYAGRRLGILTDLGHPFPALGDLLATLDGAYLESNYDPQMLASGPYPRYLKQRIAGLGGHLSNDEAVELIRPHLGGRMRWLAVAHLSAENNTPELALGKHRAAYGEKLAVRLAPREGTSGQLVLET